MFCFLVFTRDTKEYIPQFHDINGMSLYIVANMTEICINIVFSLYSHTFSVISNPNKLFRMLDSVIAKSYMEFFILLKN